jgi:hypothetical protein
LYYLLLTDLSEKYSNDNNNNNNNIGN